MNINACVCVLCPRQFLFFGTRKSGWASLNYNFCFFTLFYSCLSIIGVLCGCIHTLLCIVQQSERRLSLYKLKGTPIFFPFLIYHVSYFSLSQVLCVLKCHLSYSTGRNQINHRDTTLMIRNTVVPHLLLKVWLILLFYVELFQHAFSRLAVQQIILK